MGMNPKKLARTLLPRRGIRLAEETYRKGRVYAFQAAKGFPAKGMRVIAVTGTNGKTTTCCYINEMLKSAGYKTAVFSTAVVELNGKQQLNRTHRTVPLTAELVGFLQKARAAKVDFLILELTSQALHQHKTLGIPIEIAVMTNISQDHLDYHGSMEAYVAAKARLFNGYSSPRLCVLNRDDEYYDYYRQQSVGEVVSYGFEPDSSLCITNAVLTPAGTQWQLTEHNMQTPVSTKIPGRFNVLNASAAACVGLLLGLSPEQIGQGIASLSAVPGRMQSVQAGQDFTVLVDYAHTPDALLNVLTAARGLTKGRVIAVFGATGDRDKAKRPIMGEVVARTADMAYLTDDETYTEDPDTIRSAVREGLGKAGGMFVEIPDRREAIAAALKDAKKGDVVVLAGIGHQDTRNMGGKLLPWNEVEVAQQLLRLRK